jgi:hypothetical protein
MPSPARSSSLLIVIPSFNDWAALRLLLPAIDRTLGSMPRKASVLVIDDASTDSIPGGWPNANFSAIQSLAVLHLRCNLGHQRAIALGLYHASEFTDVDAVIVMDGDGEDRAEDLTALLAEFERAGSKEAVFAARTKRMESASFQFFYQVYRVAHRLLTGIGVRVGNFSVLPRLAITRLMGVSDLWNHYAAAVYRAKLPRRLVPLARGTRLDGKSRMNFVGLLIHGLAAISVFSDQVSARLLAVSAASALAGLGLILWTGMTLMAGALLVLAVQFLTVAVLFALTIASRRNAANFLLLRDAPHFILGKTVFHETLSLETLGARLSHEDVPAQLRVAP